jgi:2'-aminobiphenyl-2,3-diol 1,2-dioxygenase small subunit
MASYATHKLLQSFCRSPDLARRLADEPGALFAEFGIEEAEGAALMAGTPEALAGIGVHPILQVHFMIMASPDFRKGMDITPFLARLGGN